jgi:hypothetical protein
MLQNKFPFWIFACIDINMEPLMFNYNHGQTRFLIPLEAWEGNLGLLMF